ncbi:unnamed protein product [Larinioides sclopetarius]|uniref:Cytochrome P450 n=1 Tax=Larinioides sclopetarius TaxID=280406 RepID=A0AAV2BP72_9ARAC
MFQTDEAFWSAERLCSLLFRVNHVLLQGLGGICRIFRDEKLFRIYLLFKPAVFFYKPESVEVVLSSSTLIDKGREYNLLAPWLGTGLLTSTGPKWRFRRKLLTPTFHFTILEDFIPVFHEQSSVLVSKLKRLDSEAWVDVVPLMTSCTLDIICQTAMGVCINAQGDDNDDYVKAVHEIGNAFMYRVLRPWLYPDIIFKCTAFGQRFRTNLQKVQGFTRKVIKDKKAAMIESGKLSPIATNAPEGSPMLRKKRKAFLELLLEHHLKDPSFTEEDIREEVDTFMFEGHDTTAMALSWTLYLLGTHPEIQKVVHDELDDIFQNDVERDVTRDDLSHMKYLECVIKETLRLYPSVPIIGRECNESFQVGQKFAIMEEKTVLANILRRFRVISLDTRDKVLVQPNLTTKNVMPLRLRFEKR